MTVETGAPPPRRTTQLGRFGQCLRVVLLVALLGLLVRGAPLPSPRGLDAPADVASEARARQHLEVIAREPHAAGSEANAAVRAYLVRELEALGLEVERVAGTVTVQRGGEEREVELVNLLAKLPGTRAGADAPDPDVVLFACHYDSAVRGKFAAPGAGDDGAAVASFLEAARALRAGPPLANDVWFLFTDGEELGLLGAELFCEEMERPLVDVGERSFGRIQRIGAVFNFEGIGNRGPSVMFQTSPDAGPLIREFAPCAPAAVAPSFASAIYEQMPNDTDFTVFLEHGLVGLNFAIVGGRSAYHRPWDTPENLDPSTLQHQADTVLALARRFGGLKLAALRVPEPVAYFDVLGRGPVALGLRSSVDWLAALAALGLLWWGGRRRGVRTVRALLLAPLRVVAAGLVVFVLARSAGSVSELVTGALAGAPAPRGDARSAFLLAWGAAATGLALSLAFARARAVRSPDDSAATRALGEAVLGACVLWLLLGLWAKFGLPAESAALLGAWARIELPGAAYAFLLPVTLVAGVAWAAPIRVGARRSLLPALLVQIGVVALLAPYLGLLVALFSDQVQFACILAAVLVGLATPLFAVVAAWASATSRLAVGVAWGSALAILGASGVLRALGL